ncbi:MAG: NfeD family protein [Clostridia bacterium]|nr:NfeD family protein [Clostridia bacterium]
MFFEMVLEYLAGWNVLSVVLLVAGLGLVTAEMFLPGFGVFGVAGIGALIACIVLSSTTVGHALVTFVIIMCIVVLLGYVIFKNFGTNGKSRIVLKDVIASKSNEGGDEELAELCGKAGVARTALRPVGKALIDGKQYDVVTGGEFIQPGEAIEVTLVKGLRVEVRRLEGAPDGE